MQTSYLPCEVCDKTSRYERANALLVVYRLQPAVEVTQRPITTGLFNVLQTCKEHQEHNRADDSVTPPVLLSGRLSGSRLSGSKPQSNCYLLDLCAVSTSLSPSIIYSRFRVQIWAGPFAISGRLPLSMREQPSSRAGGPHLFSFVRRGITRLSSRQPLEYSRLG